MDAVQTKEFNSGQKLIPSSENLKTVVPKPPVVENKQRVNIPSISMTQNGQKSRTKSSSNCLIKINDSKFNTDSKNNLDFTKSPINVLDILQAKPKLSTKVDYGSNANIPSANDGGGGETFRLTTEDSSPVD
jgi:hypothetical protein